ncbi:MAG: hypothetical protein H2058_11785 [Muricauda sp.]|nr:hypothetical protein [Allomuricauda sp.]MBA4745926.1 hypothetical protein [Allomuricauda sp.]
MSLTIVLITSIALVFQYFVDFLKIKEKKYKKLLGLSILILGLIGIWISFKIQNDELTKTDESNRLEKANLEKRFNKIDSTNVVLRTELNLRNQDLTNISKQNDSLRSRIDELLGKQQEFLVVSQKSYEEVSKSRTALENMGLKEISRGISAVDRIKITNVLSKYPNQKITLSYPMGDQEAFQFADQLFDVLNSAGWIVKGPHPTISDRPFKGMKIWVKEKNNFPNGVYGIFKSLKILNLEAKGYPRPQLSVDEIELVIGQKK